MLAAQVQQAQAQQQHQLSSARPRTNSHHAQLQPHLLPSRSLAPLQPVPMPGSGYGFVHPNSLLPHSVLIPANLYGFNHPFSELTHPIPHPHPHHHHQVSLTPSGAFLSTNSNSNSNSISNSNSNPNPNSNSNHHHNLLPSSLTLHTRSPHPDSLPLPPLAVSRSHSAPSHILPPSPPPSRYTLHAPSAHNHMYAHRLAAGSDPNPSSIHPPRSLSLSGPPVFPLPRPRTESATSDRSRPISLHGLSQKPILNPTNVHHRLRTDSQNSRQSSPSHGFANGPSGLCVKPLNSQHDPIYAFHHSPHPSRSPTPTTHSASSTPPPSQSHSIPNSPSQTSPSSPSTHPLTLTPTQPIGTMSRRPSPLAQTTSRDSDSDHRKSASYRNSSASTINANPASSTISPPTFGPDRRDEDDDDDSEAASDPDHRQPGHRSTPGTSVDSTTSNNAHSLGNPSLATRPVPSNTTPLLEPTTHKHSKLNLSNKLRRALSIGVLHESMIQSSIPELGPTNSNERLKSSSASVAGVRLSPATPPASKSGPQSTSGRRFGFMNPKANSSTDNLSISSTVSSASVMIRKLGNLGKTARRNSVMGLTKMFKDKKEGEEDKSAEDKLERPRRSAAQHQKNSPSTSVAQVTAEVDRSLSVEFPGMTPAAAFIHKQKQQYAEQEAAAMAAAAAAPSTTTSATTGSGPAGNDSAKSRSKSSAGHNLSQSLGGGSGAPTSATEARKKMIEKEKEKLKSKKTRKWGFGSSSSTSSATETEVTPPVSSSENAQRPSVDGSEGEDSEEWDDRTVRGAAIEAAIASESAGSRDLVEELGTADEQDMMDEYDVESLFGNGSNDGGSGGKSQLKVRPPKEAVPKKGILKNAQNFSQDEYLTGGLSHSKPGSVSTTPDSLKPTTPKSEADKGTLASSTSGPSTGFMFELGGESPNLALGFSTCAKERRATFAQHLSVHSTWPPAIYDRRGEPATCNRLTPTLAQRIKEELNAFKMEEMEVHVASRIHTHFFV